MIAVLDQYATVIASYDIRRYRQYGNAYELILSIQFKDGSTLHARDYAFLDGSRKYAFHWQDKTGKLIRRWDNAEHHRHLATFPFHVHTATEVAESPPMTLDKVLPYIVVRL